MKEVGSGRKEEYGHEQKLHGATLGIQREVANERERRRMQTIGSAFERLKRCIPWIPEDTKLSKADTLRLASFYIEYLTHITEEDHESAEQTAATAMQKWPWQKTAFLFDEFQCGRVATRIPTSPDLYR